MIIREEDNHFLIRKQKKNYQTGVLTAARLYLSLKNLHKANINAVFLHFEKFFYKLMGNYTHCRWNSHLQINLHVIFIQAFEGNISKPTYRDRIDLK